jgi:hypothetical protein
MGAMMKKELTLIAMVLFTCPFLSFAQSSSSESNNQSTEMHSLQTSSTVDNGDLMPAQSPTFGVASHKSASTNIDSLAWQYSALGTSGHNFVSLPAKQSGLAVPETPILE